MYFSVLPFSLFWGNFLVFFPCKDFLAFLCVFSPYGVEGLGRDLKILVFRCFFLVLLCVCVCVCVCLRVCVSFLD